MKSIKLIFLLAIFSIFIFNSCTGEDEPIDPLLLEEVPALCSQPAFFSVSSFINGNTVRIDWDKTSGVEWEIQYGTNGFVLGNGTIVNFNTTSSLITGLTSTINYSFYIRTKCDTNEYSQWIGPIAPGSSVDVCENPTNLTAVRSATDATKITATWLANGDENSWQVQYGTSGFIIGSGTIVATASNTKIVSNLLENVAYDFYVRSNCDANQNSGWVGPVTVNAVGALGCTTPTNLAVVRNATLSSQVNVGWTAGGTETSWEIQYGNTGFAVGTGTSSVATTNPKIISGLLDTSYDFYIRAKCSATQNSSWFGPINIPTTGSSGGNYYLRMKVDGVLKNFPLDQTGSNLNALDLQILSNDSALINYFTLQIAQLQAPGVYAFADPDVTALCSYIENDVIFSSSYDDFTDSPGNITIIDLDLINNRIKGTFNFIGKDDSTPPQARVITVGEFYLPLQ